MPDEAVRPALEDLIGELQESPSPDAPDRLLALVRACLGSGKAGDVVGLHCTELPLALPDRSRDACFTWEGVRFLNASMVHVRALLTEVGLGPTQPASQGPPADDMHSSDEGACDPLSKATEQ